MLKGLDEYINTVNFKKVTKVYIMVSLLLLAIAAAGIVFTFWDKIAFTIDYLEINSRVDKQGIDSSIKRQLDALADSSPDIRDVLLLDKENSIVYSSKNSGLGKGDKLVLSKAKDNEKFLQDVNSPGIYYKVLRPKSLLVKELYRNAKDIKKEFADSFFYYTGYNTQKVYFLNYFADKQNGMKIFVISDIKTIPYAERLLESAGALTMIILGFYWILLALWVYKDANRRKQNAALWGLLILLTNLVGVIVYAIYKQNNRTCYKCGALQSRQNTFCSYCGTRISESCNKCGMIISRNDNFCTRCGTKLNN